jgi:hypothetical protein
MLITTSVCGSSLTHFSVTTNQAYLSYNSNGSSFICLNFNKSNLAQYEAPSFILFVINTTLQQTFLATRTYMLALTPTFGSKHPFLAICMP